MEGQKKKLIAVTVVLSLIEAFFYYILSSKGQLDNDNWLITFMSYAMPMGFLCFLNYYLLAPALIWIGRNFWHILGHYGYISHKFSEITTKGIVWLVDCNVHWGVIDTANECQNANTCEGILAIKKAKLNLRYSIIYSKALMEVLNNTTIHGLASKSLRHETVVCTSMILYIYANEDSQELEYLTPKFNNIAKRLWEVRAENGWGVYIEKTENVDCSFANTFWALRALNEYELVCSQEFGHMVRNIYELSSDSLFGFTMGDIPRVSVTSMAVTFYFHLDENIRKDIDEVFNVSKAITFIFKQFCIKGIECELEILQGLEKRSQGVKKAPWTHVTIGFAVEALVSAYKNNKLSLAKMDILVERIKLICKKRLVYIDEHRCYYVPKNMETRTDGKWTFPTAYLIWALSEFDF